MDSKQVFGVILLLIAGVSIYIGVINAIELKEDMTFRRDNNISVGNIVVHCPNGDVEIYANITKYNEHILICGMLQESYIVKREEINFTLVNLSKIYKD